MRVAIMQPYLFPYIGYFQLMHAVDTFVIYDDVSFIKKGWINRNRLLVNGQARFFTVPLVDASQNRRIRETMIATGPYEQFRRKFFATLTQQYQKAPYYPETKEIAEAVLNMHPLSIGDLARYSLEAVCAYVGISTRVVPSSTIYQNGQLGRVERLVDICRRELADTYVNAAGGKEIYTKEAFAEAGLTLCFLDSADIAYPQAGRGPFVANLSILDVLMNNPVEAVRHFLAQYKLV
ncbi:MAG: WbqC family protein [Verrucomicrobia bacterium]|nr:WbqC family protein [Verrucomicrobiota bacterium]